MAERQSADRFEEQFWSGGDLAGLYKSLEGGSPTGMAGVFVAGFREFSRLRKQVGMSGAQLLEVYPIGPLLGVAFNLTLMSYSGSLDMALNIDTAAISDPELLANCLQRSFRALAKN